MTDLREIVDVRGPGQPSEFVCAATVGSDLLAACGLAEDDVLRRAARAVEMELGMAEIMPFQRDSMPLNLTLKD